MGKCGGTECPIYEDNRCCLYCDEHSTCNHEDKCRLKEDCEDMIEE